MADGTESGGLDQYDKFVEQAQAFRSALVEGGFDKEEITAMLSSFPLVVFSQYMRTDHPPEFIEMVTKQTRVLERELARDEADDD